MNTARGAQSVKETARFSLAEEALENGGVLLTISGEVDIATAPALRERANAIVEAGVRRLVLDLRAVAFMDSTALAVFLRAKARLGDDGRMAIVSTPDSYPHLILEVAGLTRGLDVVETLEEGIRHVAV